MPEWLYPGGLVHLGEFLLLVCFLFRSQILLRSFAIASDLVYSSYFFVAADEPLWEAIGWSVPAVIINVVMIILILRDGRVPRLKDEEMLLFRQLGQLSPGQFRKLMKGTVWQEANAGDVLTEEGRKPEFLYFVMDGDLQMERQGDRRAIASNTFIGEIAYLHDGPASATVKTGSRARIAKWPHGFLKGLFERDEELRAAFTAMMARELALKLTRA